MYIYASREEEGREWGDLAIVTCAFKFGSRYLLRSDVAGTWLLAFVAVVCGIL